MIDLSVRVGGLTLANPVMPASGTFAEGLDRVMDFNPPRRLRDQDHHARTARRQSIAARRRARRRPDQLDRNSLKRRAVFSRAYLPYYAGYKPPLVVSISAPTAEDFARLASEMTLPGVAAIEANISCPNIEEDGKAFATRASSTETVVRHLRAATSLPLWVKLTPNTGDLPEVARAAELAGADALVVANTILAMAIDLDTFKPCLGNIMGGLSGPAIKPIVLRQVYQCARTVKIPVIGCGGISTTEDAVEYMLAGATAVQVGTATFVQPAAMTTIIDGLVKFCERRDITRVAISSAPSQGYHPCRRSHRRRRERRIRRTGAFLAGAADMTAMAMDAAIPAMDVERDTAFCERLFAALREATGDGVGITRESFGATESLALDIVENAARECGLTVERDAGANLVVTLPGTESDLAFLACGSHLDSVPQGGNYDGGAGVVAGLAVLAGLKRGGFVPRRTIKLLGLRGEESAWFGKAYMGSSAAVGRLTADDLASPHAVTGRPLLDCMCDIGADVARIAQGKAVAGTARLSPPGSNCISNRDRCWSRANCRSASSPAFAATSGTGRWNASARPDIPARCALAAPRCRVRDRRTDHPSRPPLAHVAWSAAAISSLPRGSWALIAPSMPSRVSPATSNSASRRAARTRKRSKPSTTCSCRNAPASATNAAWNSSWTAGCNPRRPRWTPSGSTNYAPPPATSACRTSPFPAGPA